MSCSKPLPPFTYDVLCYLNRDQLERFSIICHSLMNLINRYFHSKPYRVFDRLLIRRGSFALVHNDVQWHPNREDYSVQQFLAHQKCINQSKVAWNANVYYSFAEMRPYLGPTLRMKHVIMYVAGTYGHSPEHISEMESITYLWRAAYIGIWNGEDFESRIGAKILRGMPMRHPRIGQGRGRRIVAEHFQPILNSPTILQCRLLYIENAHFSFKDYKILYNVKIIEIRHRNEVDIDLWLQYWQEFLEQPGIKPIVVFWFLRCEVIKNLFDRLSMDISSVVSPNEFKIVFVQREGPLSEFRETNMASGDILELKEGIPLEYQKTFTNSEHYNCYTLERSSV